MYDAVCKEWLCTACGSCIQICPKGCIEYEFNSHETSRAVINTQNCIGCNLCREACPQVSRVKGIVPLKSYAAWSNDKETRRTSASGGIAAEIYRLFGENGWYYAGVSQDKTFDMTFKLFSGIEHINDFKNSKYAYSDTGSVFKCISDKLNSGEQVLFIGLPCQVAGLRQFIRALKVEDKRLYCVDLVCHGLTPIKFLKSHISHIENKKKRIAKGITFRDPDHGNGTHTYTLSMIDKTGEVLYQRGVHRNDTYQIGYHYGITYRDNCYDCIYACHQRVGDLTLADYSGLGSKIRCEYSGRKVSCVLVNTNKGMRLFEMIHNIGYIHAEERPIDEEMQNEKRLNAPTRRTDKSKQFVDEYDRTKDFELSMIKVARGIIIKNEIRHFLFIDFFERAINKINRVAHERIRREK